MGIGACPLSSRMPLGSAAMIHTTKDFQQTYHLSAGLEVAIRAAKIDLRNLTTAISSSVALLRTQK